MPKTSTLDESSNPTIRYAPVDLKGKTYSLAFTFNALAMAEEMSGINLMQAIRSLGNLSFSQTRALLYASILKRHPKLTLSEVGELMDFETLPLITDALSRALANSMPEASADDEHPPDAGMAENP